MTLLENGEHPKFAPNAPDSVFYAYMTVLLCELGLIIQKLSYRKQIARQQRTQSNNSKFSGGGVFIGRKHL